MRKWRRGSSLRHSPEANLRLTVRLTGGAWGGRGPPWGQLGRPGAAFASFSDRVWTAVSQAVSASGVRPGIARA